MLLRRISYTIALQFMWFVFLLLLINGFLFLAADFGNERRQANTRLITTAEIVVQRTKVTPQGLSVVLPPALRERVRVVDVEGNIVYSGAFFEGIPFENHDGIRMLQVGDDRYRMLTTSILREGKVAGYMQLVDYERAPYGDLPLRSLIYFFVSAIVTGLTFWVGLFFARRSLRPAEDMMERLEQFTQDASHELRTPLATLSTSLDLALQSKNYEQGIRSAKDDVKDITVLIERLLELARIDTLLLDKETINFSELTKETVERHSVAAAEQGITLSTSIEPNVFVEGDNALLRRVISNLLSNAFKFKAREPATVHVSLTRKELRISDNGIGIAAENLEKIFNRFFQAETSRNNNGFGLGLALVKRIVEVHGWSIRAESTEGKGTVFIISIFSRSKAKKSS